MLNSGPNGEWRSMERAAFDTLPPCTGWKVWTVDGSTYDSDHTSWRDLGHGLEVLKTFHDNGGSMLWTGYDDYCCPLELGTKLGKMMDRDAFEAISLAARDDTWRPGHG